LNNKRNMHISGRDVATYTLIIMFEESRSTVLRRRVDAMPPGLPTIGGKKQVGNGPHPPRRPRLQQYFNAKFSSERREPDETIRLPLLFGLRTVGYFAAQHLRAAANMAKQMIPQVQNGDRFIKVGEPHGKIWQVVNLSIAVDGILHARLQDDSRQNGSMTIAAGVLADPRFWNVARPV